MSKKTRIGLTAAAVAVLGAAILAYPSTYRDLFTYGVQRGKQDAQDGRDAAPAMISDPPSALVYLEMAPSYIESHMPVPKTPAERLARNTETRRASRLADLVTGASESRQKFYLK